MAIFNSKLLVITRGYIPRPLVEFSPTVLQIRGMNQQVAQLRADPAVLPGRSEAPRRQGRKCDKHSTKRKWIRIRLVFVFIHLFVYSCSCVFIHLFIYLFICLESLFIYSSLFAYMYRYSCSKGFKLVAKLDIRFINQHRV